MIKIKMTQLDILWAIFSTDLYLLTEEGAAFLLESYQRALLQTTAGGANRLSEMERMQRLLTANAEELQRLVQMDADEEDTVIYLNIFLWKQKNGRIGKQLRIAYEFEEHANAWLIHRFMAANGYEGVEHIPFEIHDEEERTTDYATEIERYLGFFKAPSGYEDDDYFSYLADLLSVIGPQIQHYNRLPEVREFVDYILRYVGDDERLRWLDLVPFTFLLTDLAYSPDTTWPVYQKLIQREDTGGISNYPALLFGIRMYGNQAREELQKVDIMGGYDLLDALASR